MHIVDVFLLVMVLVVSAWIARGSDPVVCLVLFASALLISAALFLPSSLLSAVAGTDALALLESGASALSWTLANIFHFIAFLWLALVLWMLRPDLRGWRVVVGLVVLAIAAELAQELTVERSARVSDAVINLIGAGVGLTLAATGSALWGFLCSQRTRHCPTTSRMDSTQQAAYRGNSSDD